MQVLFEDDRVVVVDKPPGVATIPDRTGSDSVHAQLQALRGERLWVVHRLDREVTGILVFARSAPVHREISMAFEEHKVKKTYSAITDGFPPGPIGHMMHWQDKLLRGKKRSYPSPHGKDAVTDAVFEGQNVQGLHWTVLPRTGRNHQIRVHLSQSGYPIVGDALYGSETPWPAGIALRAIGLRCIEAGLDLRCPGFDPTS
jgi:tRNA pseudouridine32 synthase/23S rRNA pseudouridine746 synthase